MTVSWVIRLARFGLSLGIALGAIGLATFGEERKPAAAGQTPRTAGEPAASPERINRLIRQLGDKDYFVREHAQDELAQLGVNAFDALSAATEDEDPEIAARAKYLLQIPVEWMVKSDPPIVRGYLGNYGKLDVAERGAAAKWLASLPDGEGVDAVCRLVRFDRSALVSKAAATVLLPRGQAAVPVPQATLDAIRKRLSGCRRPGAVWLCLLAQFGSDPAVAAAGWSKLADAEYQLWRQTPGKSSAEIVGCLLRVQVAWLNKLGKHEQSAGALHRLLDLEDNGDAESLTDLAQWLVDRKVWPGMDELSRRFAARFDHETRLLYLSAEAYAEQGQSKRAEETALRAFQTAARQVSEQEEDSPHQIATWLQERGRFSWAKREFARVIAAGNRRSATFEEQCAGAVASIHLAEMLHDQGEDFEAAHCLQQVTKGFQSGGGGPLATQLGNYGHPPRELRALMNYYFACHWESQRKTALQRECLDKALKDDPNELDVLIACYRLPDDPRGYHAGIVEAVERTAAMVHARMASSPIPNLYNEYAWLVGNTEGDFEEAVRCSFKSLELHPDEGAYYDTLGHAYFGKGDWENAVKYQAIAAELDPHSGLIQKALVQFRKKLNEGKRPPK